jgi:hypothetical protein
LDSARRLVASVSAPYPGLTPIEVLLAIFLVSLSGVGVLVHTFGPVPMDLTAPFVVLPAGWLLAGAIMLRRRLPERFHTFTKMLPRGMVWGLLATFGYDAIRPPLVSIAQFDYDPFKAIYIFGELITGGVRGEFWSDLAGWSYHFWNGMSFAMMYAILFPRGGWFTALLWGEVLQMILIYTYQDLINLKPFDTGVLVTGLVGHGVWGLILGIGMRYSWDRDDARVDARAAV